MFRVTSEILTTQIQTSGTLSPKYNFLLPALPPLDKLVDFLITRSVSIVHPLIPSNIYICVYAYLHILSASLLGWLVSEIHFPM